MREPLWRSFPAMLDLESDLAAPWPLDLSETASTPDKARRSRETTVAGVREQNRIRRLDAAQVLKALRREPVAAADGTIAAASAPITTPIARIRLLSRQVDDAHRRLDRLTADFASSQKSEPGQVKQHDAEILASLPPYLRAGSGKDRPRPIIRQRGLAEAFDALQRRDQAALRSRTGVAPVTEKSGKSCIVVRRQACNNRLSNAVYHWARVAMRHDQTSRAEYAAL